MNAAEKARLAKEKEEQEKREKREQSAKRLRRQMEDISGWTLLVVTGLCALGTILFGYFALIGGLDASMYVWAWLLIAFDVIVIGLDALHAKWAGTMLVIDEGVAVYAIFIGFVFLSALVLLIKSVL